MEHINRRVCAIKEFHGREQELGGTDVLNRVEHVFAWSVVAVPGFTDMMIPSTMRPSEK